MDILFTGALGDIFALDSLMSPRERRALRHVYWATRSAPALIPLFEASRAYRDVEHTVLPAPYTYFELAGVQRDNPDVNLSRVQDWSISVRFGEWRTRPHNPSTFLGASEPPSRLRDVPDRYVLVQHQTPANGAASRALRDLDASEWSLIIDRLAKEDTRAVVVNSPDADAPPMHPRVINLVGKTSLAESIALLSRAEGYWGIASSLCVLASQLFNADQLWVKGPEDWLKINRHVYFAPHRAFPFLVDHLGETGNPKLNRHMKQVVMNRMRVVDNKLVGPGSLVEVSDTTAATLLATGQATPFLVDELQEAKLTPVLRRATKYAKGGK